jgi:hypothetical protein
MASLTHDAEVARQQAEELRRIAFGLRASARRGRIETKRRRTACLRSYVQLHQIWSGRVRSGWSDLLWERPGDELDRVLVPLD